MKAEKYIEIVSDKNGHLCDLHALKAVEIAREETIKQVCDWLDKHACIYATRALYTETMITDLKRYLDELK